VHFFLRGTVQALRPRARALHLSTFQIKVSTFRGIHCVVSVIKTAQVEPKSGGVRRPCRVLMSLR